MKKPFSILTLVSFLITGLGPIPAQAQGNLPLRTYEVAMASNVPMLKGLKVHANRPFEFDFVMDAGDENPNRRGLIHQTQLKGMINHAPTDIKQESTKLIKYAVALSDGRILTAGRDQTARIWKKVGVQWVEATKPLEHPERVGSAKELSDGRIITVSDTIAYIWEAQAEGNYTIIERLEHDDWISSAYEQADGRIRTVYLSGQKSKLWTIFKPVQKVNAIENEALQKQPHQLQVEKERLEKLIAYEGQRLEVIENIERIEQDMSEAGSQAKLDNKALKQLQLRKERLERIITALELNVGSSTPDQAQVSKNKDLGGIDLNPDLLKTEIKEQGQMPQVGDVQLPAELTHLTGLVPYILTITPIPLPDFVSQN